MRRMLTQNLGWKLLSLALALALWATFGRDAETATSVAARVHYKNLTGTIPASSVEAAAETPKAETPKKEEAKPSEPPAPPRKAQTMYGKAVEKAKENADKNEKNLVKPTDEIMGK